MHRKMSKLLWIIPIISLIIVGECLKANAKQTQIDDEVNPDLFHIGTFTLKINVSKTEFSPATFTVKESATVNLTVESIDVGHTFVIEEYGIEEEIKANSSEVIEFVVDKVGTFVYSSVNCSETGTMIVESPYAPGLPRPENLTILLDISHSSMNLTETNQKFSGLLNWTRDHNFTMEVNVETEVIESTLEGVDVLMIFDAAENLTRFEIEGILSFVRSGGGLLVGGSQDSSSSNIYEITKPFGFQLLNATARYINATDITDPIGINTTLPLFSLTEFTDHPIINENLYVPLTEENITRITYTGPLIQFNSSWATENLVENNLTRAGEITDCYTIARGNETIFADIDGNMTVGENETIGWNNTFIVAAETAMNGRIVGIGSSDILNDTLLYDDDNEIFYQRVLQWLAKMYSVLQSKDYTLEVLEIRIGEKIQTHISVFAQNNTLVSPINVTLRVWRLAKIEETLALSPTNESYYEGVLDTKNITRGTVSIDIIAHKRGYGFNSTQAIYVKVDPAAAKPLAVSPFYIITYALSLIVGVIALSFFFVRAGLISLIKKRREEKEEVEEAPEEEEAVDLTEYELEEEEEAEELSNKE